MIDISWETEQFELHRPHLEAVAYRMLGSVSEAEDALQEAWLRLRRSRQDTIHNARAWLTTIVGRVCIDMLRTRRSRREEYVGAWVPEPIVDADEQADPEQQALLADTVGLALLVVLETLAPAERVAYVLHDMFALPFAEIGDVIDRSPEAARQLASRARRRVREAIPQPDADLTTQREVVEAFLAASRGGDFDALVAMLDPDVVLRAGGAGGRHQELNGAAGVARSVARIGPAFASLCRPAMVNGHAGLLITAPGERLGAIGFTVTRGLIATIDVTLDPDRLERLNDRLAARGPGLPGGQTAGGEASLLGYVRGVPGSAAEWIIGEALRWPGVARAGGHFGSVALRVGGRELGHLHGDAVVDVPLPSDLADQRVPDKAALEEQRGHDPGWIRVPLDGEEAVRHALALLRANYEHEQTRAALGRARGPA